MSEKKIFWFIVLAVVVFLFLVFPEFMKGVLLLLSIPIGLFLFIRLIGGFQSFFEKKRKREAEKEETYRNLDAIRALEYQSVKSCGEYHNGWARVVISDHRYTYVKKVNGVMVFIKPDSTIHEVDDIYTGGKKTIEIKNTDHANFFEEAEEFYHQSAIVKRDGKVALLGVNGQYVFPFDYGDGETISSSFDKFDDNCLIYHRLFNNPKESSSCNSETKIINRDGKILYDGYAQHKKIENGCLVILDGGYRQEIVLKTAKVVLPFCLTHFDLDNGTKLVFSRRNGNGWNVYDPTCQSLLFDCNYSSIIYLNKRDAYLAIDDKKIRVANSNGQIVHEFPATEIKYIYEQQYLYGDYSLYDLDGKQLFGWPNFIHEVIHDEEVPHDTIWWSTYIDPKETPKEPPFTRMKWGKILFFICSANFHDSVIDLHGKTVLGPYNSTIQAEYDQETNKLSGFAYYIPWSKSWAHCDLDGNLICKNKILPSLKRDANKKPVSKINKEPTNPAKSTNSLSEVKEKRLLFFDTETTGLPRNYNAPVSDLDNWPRLVQLSWIVTDANGNDIKVKDFIIKPDGFTIPEESSKVHGITTEMAIRDGNPLQNVLEDFVTDIETADMIVGHNVEFDKKIVGAEFLRCNIQSKALDKRTVCTMKSSTNYCALPGKYGYKWPTLLELHNKLFGESFENAHNSLNDIKATKKCFFELREIGIIS